MSFAVAEPARELVENTMSFFMTNHSEQRLHTVIYDGKCGFCRKQIEHLRRPDITGRLRFVSLHDPGVPGEFPDLSHDQLMVEMWVVAPDGSRYGGIRAVNRICRALPVMWPAAMVLAVPGMIYLGGIAYRHVAGRRYTLTGSACSDGVCRSGKKTE